MDIWCKHRATAYRIIGDSGAVAMPEHLQTACMMVLETHDPSYSECERHWPIQSGADFHERTRDDKYLYKLYANRNYICGSGKYARLPVE